MKNPTIPKTVRLAGRTFQVEVRSDEEFCKEYMGRYLGAEGRILLNKNMCSDQMKAIAIHEIVHDLDGNAHTELGERGVNALSALLFAMLRDNPKLVEWLMST